ncbi:MAG: ABC transporter permease [Clostridia bacterium]|nr:ABC transporter permease [Clostridia bacterium]
MKAWKLPLRNLARKPGRTAALIALTAFLALSMFAGSVVALSLRRGMSSLENRLGADVIVVPVSAKSKVNLDEILLQGATGYFYMDAELLPQLAKESGVAQLSPQLFLASLRASCCSVAVQVIGIDQDTDFTVQPWISRSYAQRLGEMDVAVGSKISADVGENIILYETRCHVVARLETTGTAMDTCVYCSMETLRALLEAARGLNHDLKISGDPEEVVSAVYLKVQEGMDPQKVADSINLQRKFKKVQAVRTKSMFTGIADSLSGVSRTIGLLVVAVWALAVVLLLIAFLLSANERKREFAVLRLLGTSRRMLAGLMWRETALCSLMGGVLGVALAALILFPFAGLIEHSLGLPYLMPAAPTMALLAAASLAAAVLVGSLASAWATHRLSRVDPGTILREGN